MRELETETSVVWPAWCYSGEAQIVEESPQIAASPSLLVAAAAAAAATTIVTRNPSQSLKAAKPRHHKSTSMTSSSATFNKMLTDHMLSNLQEAKKFPFNQSLLATAKSYADLTGDFAENASKNQIKSERLSPANLKTEIELETYQPSSYLRSPIQTPTPPTSPRPNESSSFVPARPADGEDGKPNHFIGDNVDSASFLPPPPNHFNARNYSDIMRSLAAKYNSCSNEILPPSGTFDSRGSSQAKALPESSYSNSNQLNPNTTNPALTGLLTGLRLSQAAIFPPFMDMSSTQTLLTLAKVAKEAEVHKAKSGAKPNSDQGALSRQIGQLLSLSSNTSSSSRSKNKNGETDLTHSPLDLSSSPVSKRIKLSSDSPIGDGASSTKSTSSGKLSPKTRPVCEREAASREVNAWTLDQVADFVGSIDICAEYAQNFREQQIDGTGLPLLTEEHLTGSLGMKLGPALKLRSLLTKRLSVACSCPSCSLTLAFGPSNSDESSTLLRAELS